MNKIRIAAIAILDLLALAGCGEVTADRLTPDGGQCSHASVPPPSEDPSNRVYVAEPNAKPDFSVAFPPPTTSWQLQYKFKVPPLPCSETWNSANQVFYVWGDIDFDQYDSNGDHPLSDYSVNQVVPQVMVGDTIAGNDSLYHPIGRVLDSWTIEAVYFWQHADGTRFTLSGAVIPVDPGDETTTSIRYDATSGQITASISASSGTSSITIDRPFLNETPPLFESWKDYFSKGAAASSTLLARPMMNVESHYVDAKTLCGLLPLHVDEFSGPNTPASPSSFVVGTLGDFTCRERLATLDF